MLNKKVLILDNDKDFLSELEETLSLSGYDMIAVDDSREVLAIIDKVKVDLVLLDLKMPKKTGFDVAYELNRSPHLNHIPVMAMTGFYKEEYEPLFVDCGIKRCLIKPFQPLDVINAIEEVLIKESRQALNTGLMG